MTPRERILAAIQRQPVDRVPCRIRFNELSPQQRQGYKWQLPWAQDTAPEEKLRYQVEQLGLDQTVESSVDLCRPEKGVESKVWLDEDVLHKVYSTPAGELHAAIRFNEKWPHGKDIPFYSDFNVGHYEQPWIRTQQDLECFKHAFRLNENEEVMTSARQRCEKAKDLAGGFDLATFGRAGMGLTGAQQLFGAADLCMKTIEDPELVNAYLDYEHGMNLRAIDFYAGQGIDIILRNGFYESADFYSPAALERFLGQRLREEADAAHEAGMLFGYILNTGVMPILDFVAGLPIDFILGIDPAFPDIDLDVLKDKLGTKKSIWTGPSSAYHFWEGPEVTRQAVRDIFEKLGKTGLVLSPSVSVHCIAPWESAEAMMDEWRRLR
jgi:uroporphyrinogen-III decarboxylase